MLFKNWKWLFKNTNHTPSKNASLLKYFKKMLTNEIVAKIMLNGEKNPLIYGYQLPAMKHGECMQIAKALLGIISIQHRDDGEGRRKKSHYD